MNNVLAYKIVPQFVNIDPQLINLLELIFRNTGCQQMELGAILRKINSDFTTDERIRKVCYIQSAINFVVIRNGDEIHPLLDGLVIDFFGLGIAFS